VRRAAAAWLAANRPGAVELRFDVAVLVGARLEVLPAAF
jgi:Holliday junction resolvase-like predicted endonuclease